MAIRTIHQTDLFRPFEDPDDHWDLACQYALVTDNAIELSGILIDSPPAEKPGDPDVQAIAQLNVITGKRVPFGIGTPQLGGIEMLLCALAQGPLVIHIVGSSRDVALAIQQQPGLFEKNCKGIYLNAGSGRQNDFMEYNVELDPASYGAIFSAPCPVYWMPCFDTVPEWGKQDMQVGKYGTFYRFMQSDILNELSPRMQNFFVSVLTRDTDCRFLRTLNAPVNQEKLTQVAGTPRNMWCTGGFLHAAGYSVDEAGNIVDLHEGGSSHIFGFTPIDIRCDSKGRTHWTPREAQGATRYIFTLYNEQAYPAAMVQAMKTLLTKLA